MVHALVELDEDTNRVLNVIKAKHGLKDKGQAIQVLVSEYVECQQDPELRPDFVRKMHRVAKERSIRVRDFAKRYGIEDVRTGHQADR